MSKEITGKFLLRTIERMNLVTHTSSEAVADFLFKNAKNKLRLAGQLGYLANYLNKVVDHGFAEFKAEMKVCPQCGGLRTEPVDPTKPFVRTVVVGRDSQIYCSAKCRQKAYRKRVTVRTKQGSKQASRGDGSPDAGKHLAVTGARHE